MRLYLATFFAIAIFTNNLKATAAPPNNLGKSLPAFHNQNVEHIVNPLFFGSPRDQNHAPHYYGNEHDPNRFFSQTDTGRLDVIAAQMRNLNIEAKNFREEHRNKEALDAVQRSLKLAQSHPDVSIKFPEDAADAIELMIRIFIDYGIEVPRLLSVSLLALRLKDASDHAGNAGGRSIKLELIKPLVGLVPGFHLQIGLAEDVLLPSPKLLAIATAAELMARPLTLANESTTIQLCLETALAIREPISEKHAQALADLFDHLADVYIFESRYLDTEQVLRRALEIYDIVRPDTLVDARTRAKLAILYVLELRWRAAEQQWRTLVNTTDQHGQPSDVASVQYRYYLAHVLARQQRWTEGLKFLEPAIKIPPSPPRMEEDILAAKALADIYMALGRQEDARPYYEYVERFGETFDFSKYNLADAEAGLGRVYKSSGDVKKALAVLQHSLDYIDDPKTNEPYDVQAGLLAAEIVEEIGTIYIELHQPRQARPYLRRAYDYAKAQGASADVERLKMLIAKAGGESPDALPHVTLPNRVKQSTKKASDELLNELQKRFGIKISPGNRIAFANQFSHVIVGATVRAAEDWINVTWNYPNLERMTENELFADAFRESNRELEMAERSFGADNVVVARILVRRAQSGSPKEAIEWAHRAAVILDKSASVTDLSDATAVMDLAKVLTSLGDYDRSETVLQNYLAKANNNKDAIVTRIMTLGALGSLYLTQNRYADAGPVLKKMYEMEVTVVNPNDKNLSQIRDGLKRLDAINAKDVTLSTGADNLFSPPADSSEVAVSMAREEVRRVETTKGPRAPEIVSPLLKLAEAIMAAHRRIGLAPDFSREQSALDELLGTYSEMHSLYDRALAIIGRTQGGDSRNAAALHMRTGALFAEQVRETETVLHDVSKPELRTRLEVAENAAMREGAVSVETALHIYIDAMSPDDPELVGAYSTASLFYVSVHLDNLALEKIARASEVMRIRADRGFAAGSETYLGEIHDARAILARHLALMARGLPDTPDRAEAALPIAELALTTGTERAVALMAARMTSSDDVAFQNASKQRSKILFRLGEIAKERRAIFANSGSNPAVDVSQIGKLRSEYDALTKQLATAPDKQGDPSQRKLSRMWSVSSDLHELQHLLDKDEVLLAYLAFDDAVYALVVRNNMAAFLPLPVDRATLDGDIRSLRRGLRPGIYDALLRGESPAALFDVPAAFHLYTALIAPVHPMLGVVKKLLVVLDNPLQSLPLSALVVKMPENPGSGDLRGVHWLAADWAVTVLPSMSTMRFLREDVRPSRAKQPFIGFGDPVLGISGSSGPGTAPEGSGAPSLIETERRLAELPLLPESSVELYAMARALKAAPIPSVRLGEKMTRRSIRQAELRDYQVIAFATHALVAGEFNESAPPGLVVSLPEKGPVHSIDGMLSVDDILGLKLDAELVVLSACDTAAPDGTPNAESLSGLAKAFLYSGARSLLVAQWEIASDAAEALTTSMFSVMQDQPLVDRSEALRSAMMTLANSGDPRRAHPIFWAPFMIVGDNRASTKSANTSNK